MAQIDGKQTRDNSIADVKLVEDYVNSDGTVALTADWAVGSNKLTGLTDGATGTQDAATVAQVEALIVSDEAGLLDFKGDYNAGTNSPDLDTSPSGIKQGDFYVVSAAGTFFTEEVRAGDSLFAKQDDPTTLAHWTMVQRNIDVDDSTIEYSGIKLQLKDDGTTGAKLAPAVADDGLQQDGSGNLQVEAADDSIQVAAGGVTAATPTASNKNMTASVTASDNDSATATTVADNPANGSYPQLMINGVQQLIGDGTKVSVDCYISGDGGTTARAFSAIVAADTIRWNGSVAGFELAATDKIELNYVV